MKNLLFFLFLSLFAFGQIQAQTNSDAQNLVADARESFSEVDSLVAKTLRLRDVSQKNRNQNEVVFFNKLVKLLREMRGFGTRIVEAGDSILAADVRKFRAEIAGFEKRADVLLANPPQNSASSYYKQCFGKCDEVFKNKPIRRIACKICCVFCDP